MRDYNSLPHALFRMFEWQGLSPSYYTIRRYHGSSGEDMAAGSGSGVMAVSPSGGYYNGRSETSSYVMGTLGRMILIGCLGSNSAGAPSAPYATADVRAVAIYDVTLSAVQVRDASRQMAYCDSNPDWSVWSTPKLMPMRYYPATPANHRNRPLTGVG